MKKIYEAPELKVIKYTLYDVLDVLSSSPTEDVIGEHIDPGNPDDPINLGDL